MNQPTNGGPAFPCDVFDGKKHTTSAGMDLRDYFAAEAMQADLTGHISHYGHESHWPVDEMASHAYEVADAMLKARSA
jgi:hypothetical protein